MTDLTKIRNEVLTKVYAEAEPPLDFEDLLENSDDYPDDWFSNHYLPKEREKEIFEEVVSEYDLTDSEHASLSVTCITSLGPTNKPIEE